MPAPTAEATATSTGISVTSFTPTSPPGVVGGDLLVCCLHLNVPGTTITPPAGWTLADSQASSITLVAAYMKIATGTDDYTFGFGGTSNSPSAIVSRITGADAASPLDAATKATGSGVSRTDIPAPAITTTGPDRLVLRYVGAGSLPTGYPAGHTGLGIVDHTREQAGASIVRAVAGTEPAAVFPIASGFPNWVALSLAIAPAAGPTTNLSAIMAHYRQMRG